MNEEHIHSFDTHDSDPDHCVLCCSSRVEKLEKELSFVRTDLVCQKHNQLESERQFKALAARIEALTKERDAACEDARSKQERMQRVIDGSKTLAAETVRLRSTLEKLRPAAPSICPLIDDALSAPATSNWSVAFEALVKEHEAGEKIDAIGQERTTQRDDECRWNETWDAAESALAALKK